MNVKRTSYFTFLVAITTMATVTSCNKVKEQAITGNAVSAFVPDNPQELFNICLEGLGKQDYRFGLAKVLKDKGRKAGKFKLAIDPSGNLSVYLVFDKDYKGPVSAKIFDNKSQDYGHRMLLLAQTGTNPADFAGPAPDRRTGIAIRNRILLE